MTENIIKWKDTRKIRKIEEKLAVAKRNKDRYDKIEIEEIERKLANEKAKQKKFMKI